MPSASYRDSDVMSVGPYIEIAITDRPSADIPQCISDPPLNTLRFCLSLKCLKGILGY